MKGREFKDVVFEQFARREGDKLHPHVSLLKEFLKINTFWFSGGWMFSLLTFLIGAIFNLLKSKKELIIQICLHKKELEILKRQNQKKRLKFHHCDRIIFSILNRLGNIKETISIVKHETVLRWQKHLIKLFWTYKTKNRVGRPPVQSEIKQIILCMKNDNLCDGFFYDRYGFESEVLCLFYSLSQNPRNCPVCSDPESNERICESAIDGFWE